MKKGMLLAALALAFLTGCGGQADAGGAEDADVALSSLYAGMEAACGWGEDYMTALEGDLLEGYYPGLSGLPAKQLVAMVPAMSSDVNEIVLFQGETEEDAESAAAWYPETLAAWKSARVLRQGTSAALIASGAFQTELEEQVSAALS